MRDSMLEMAESTADRTSEDIAELIEAREMGKDERATPISFSSRLCILDSAEERRERTKLRVERIGAKDKELFSSRITSRSLNMFST